MRSPLRWRQLLVPALLVVALPGLAVRAGVILQPGDIVAGGGDVQDGIFAVAMDPILGFLYGVTFSGIVYRIDPKAFDSKNLGANLVTVGQTGGGTSNPPTIEIEAARTLLIGESFQFFNSIVVRIDPSGYDAAHPDANRTLLRPILPGNQINSLYGIAVDANGKIVASEQGAQRILRIDPSTYDPQSEHVGAAIVSSGNLLVSSDYGERAVAVVPEPDAGLVAALCVLGLRRARPRPRRCFDRPAPGPAA
jgi:hypothetical protein